MNKLEKALRYTALYSIYKSQLSTSQQEILNDYFFLDLSISEIAENRNTSRAAVEDALSKGVNKLDDLENNLKILEKNKMIIEKLEKIKAKSLNITEVLEIEEIEKELDYGIWSINR